MSDSIVGAASMFGPAPRRRQPPAKAGARHDAVLYAALALLVWATWWVSRLRLFTAASDTGYWIGVAGGVCMLLLFTYPMRKRLRFMQRFGPGKPWFIAHMVLGVSGPMLILLHSTYRIGSINAGVALFSMLIVAASGVVGRFLYVRLHRDLHGERLNLVELRCDRAASASHAARLRLAPGVAQRLVDFEQRAIGEAGSARSIPAALLLPLHRWQVQRACRQELKAALLAAAHKAGWSRSDTRRALHKAVSVVQEDLTTVQRIAQFSAWQRLFSWWHVAHVPIVYLMVMSVIAHIVAVHAY